MTTVHLFPGQGSHRIGMGREQFVRYPHLVRQADELLGYSVEELCLTGPSERLGDTRYTQPALYVVDALSYLDQVRDTGVVPSLLAGHSLGEYVALFAGGAFDFLTGLEVVAERARLMSTAPPGGMAAVIGLGVEDLRTALDRHHADGVDIANINAPTQVVVSGPREELSRLSAPLGDAGASAVSPLPVSGAFHSRYMAPAAHEFARFLGRYRFNRIKIPVLSNVTARPYDDGELADLLARQLTEPVRWTDCMAYVLDQPDSEVTEVGPGRVLEGVLRRIREQREADAEVRA